MKKRVVVIFAILSACFSGLSAALAAARNDLGRKVQLLIPAETALACAQKILPLDIPLRDAAVQGRLRLESLDRLDMANNVISAHGVLSGSQMSVNATVAGAPLRVRLGEIRLPVTCNLHLRFDRARGQLYVTPRFSGQGQSDSGLSALFDGLAGKEYPLDLDALRRLDLRVGERNIMLDMRPDNIVCKEHALFFSLRPRVK